MTWLELAAGLVLLLAGGEALVRGSVAAATRMGVSPLVIGLTLVGFGTSTPELVASLEAAMTGAPGIAVGNVVGSNIANILLILGISAVLLPIATDPRAFRRDGAVLVGAAIAMAGAVVLGTLSRPVGIVFVALLAGYLIYTYLSERRAPQAAPVYAAEAEVKETPMPLWAALGLTAGGIAGVVLGAQFLVAAAVEIARGAGMSEAVIGVTLVAVGTSLPELVTSVMAAIRRQGDVAFGNVVGSNIFNVLGIAGVTAVVSPIAVPPEIARLDIWVMLGATALLVVFSTTGRRISRGEGAIFLALYAAYLAVLLG